MSDTRMNKRWRVDGTPQSYPFGGYAISVRVQDERGRYDLNVVDDATLRELVHEAGVEEPTVEALTDRILDWRTKSDGSLSRLHGATDADYATAGVPWRPRHGPFQSVDELQLVLGLTPAIFARIRPALTVYTDAPQIDPQIAPAIPQKLTHCCGCAMLRLRIRTSMGRTAALACSIRKCLLEGSRSRSWLRPQPDTRTTNATR